MQQEARPAWWRRTGLAGAVLALVLVAGACSGDDDDTSGKGGGPAGGGTSSAPALATSVVVGRVTGSLPAAGRERLTQAVQKVIDGWWDAAYLGGDYPRTDFADSWPGFTRGAQAQARRDAALTSNQAIGGALEEVTAQRKDVRLDVVAFHHRPVGVTARVALRFTTTATDGGQDGAVNLTGRVYLTPTKAGWQVFGYDLTKGS